MDSADSMMDVLVVGGGAREHALVWKLKASPHAGRVLVAPGNGGTAAIAENVPVAVDDVDTLLQLAADNSIALTVVGPEAPLAAGIVDRFQRDGLAVFGPTREGSKLEWSKAFARYLMRDIGVPSPDFKVFHDYSQAASFLERHAGPLVVKADGLAAGKGVLMCDNREEALAAVDQCMRQRAFGVAGETVVLEECLSGPEISVFAFCDGENASEMAAACDYKRALDGDQGPNTGGMGSYSPPAAWTPKLQAQVRQQVIQPVIRAMAERGTPYRGVLYAGLMLTAEGPKVLEFNCRLGDPEAQVVLSLLESDLLDLLTACAQGRVSDTALAWSPQASAAVVMVSGGYPGDYRKGLPIAGVDDLDDDVLVFHGGTRASRDSGHIRYFTDGGRVLTVVGQGEDLAAARERAYANLDRISFQGAYYRRDIALVLESQVD